jgi:hypothetical protein
MARIYSFDVGEREDFEVPDHAIVEMVSMIVENIANPDKNRYLVTILEYPDESEVIEDMERRTALRQILDALPNDEVSA